MKKIIQVSRELEDIVPRFLANRYREVPLLHSAVESADFAMLEILGHKLKGTAGGYGFFELGEIASRLEKAAEQRSLPLVKESVTEFENHLGEVQIQYVDE